MNYALIYHDTLAWAVPVIVLFSGAIGYGIAVLLYRPVKRREIEARYTDAYIRERDELKAEIAMQNTELYRLKMRVREQGAQIAAGVTQAQIVAKVLTTPVVE